MRVLFIGDVVGRPGRQVVRAWLPQLQRDLNLSLIVANGENAAGGAGITPSTAKELFDAGVHVLTSGDHVWDHRDVYALMDAEPYFLRPLNYPKGTPGNGSVIWESKGLPPVAVINLQGRTFLPPLEHPFEVIDREIQRLRHHAPIILVDFHAEATSEKIALGRFLDGRVSMVAGTHTHVPTADEQIFPGGTAFICDVGFTGPQKSVLGRQIDPVIQRFLTLQPQRFGVASEEVMLRGILVEIDPSTGKATHIERIARRLEDAPTYSR